MVRTALPGKNERSEFSLARALATPTRACAITHARIPRDFLIDFDLMSHPETKRPWLVPTGLIVAPKSAGKASQKQDGLEEKPTVGQSLRAPRSHIVASKALIQPLAAKLGTEKAKQRSYEWNRIVNPSLVKKYSVSTKSVVYREDMADHILDLLRQRVLHELSHLAGLWANHIQAPQKQGLAGVAEEEERVASVLWVGPSPVSSAGMTSDPSAGHAPPYPPATETTAASQPLDGSDENRFYHGNFRWDPTTGPPPYARVKAKGSMDGFALIYNLPALIGSSRVEALVQTMKSVRKAEFLIIRHSGQACAAQRWLWKLQCYMGPLLHDEE